MTAVLMFICMIKEVTLKLAIKGSARSLCCNLLLANIPRLLSPLSPSLNTVELLRSLRVVLRILATHGKTHCMPTADVAADHPLVGDVLPNLALQLGLNPQPQ